ANTDLAAGAAVPYNGTTAFVDTGTSAGGTFEYELCSDSSTTVLGGATWAVDISHLTLIEVNDNGDLAEVYPTNDPTIGMGEVVSIDPALRAGVVRTQKAYDKSLLGVITTK